MSNMVVHPSGPLRGAVVVPGDKSISHRALLLGGLAEGPTRVTGWLPALDCQATLRCMRGLGVRVDQEDDTTLTVHGVGLRGLREPVDVLDCGGSGTTMRLLAGILAGQPFLSIMTGNEALRRRPMARVAGPLRQMGAAVDGREGGRLPPLAIRGGELRGFDYTLPMASAQVKSAVLLASLFAEGETIVREPGPTRDHTERLLRAFGVTVITEGPVVRVTGGQTMRGLGSDGDGTGLQVPADFSSAAFMLVAGSLVPGSEVWVRNVGVNPTRTGLMDALLEMGAEIGTNDLEGRELGLEDTGEPIADLYARSCGLRAGEVCGNLVVRMIDELPIFAVAATQAEGTTVIRDAGELRVKESDRISAVTLELRKMGANVEEQPDGMLIHGPTQLRGAAVDSHRDHRVAMALAIAGLIAIGDTLVQQAECVDDSYPGFAETLSQLGAEINTVN